MFNEEYCLKTGEIEFNLDSKSFVIERYRYDKPDVEDEQQNIYFNNELGLLVTHSSMWLTTVTYEANWISIQLINEIVNDDTGFFK